MPNTCSRHILLGYKHTIAKKVHQFIAIFFLFLLKQPQSVAWLPWYDQIGAAAFICLKGVWVAGLSCEGDWHMRETFTSSFTNRSEQIHQALDGARPASAFFPCCCTYSEPQRISWRRNVPSDRYQKKAGASLTPEAMMYTLLVIKGWRYWTFIMKCRNAVVTHGDQLNLASNTFNSSVCHNTLLFNKVINWKKKKKFLIRESNTQCSGWVTVDI